MVSFLHAADLHLDSPFRALPPEQAAVRRREQRQLLDELARLVARRKCDLVLLAGDVLDGAAARPETVEALRRCLEACRVPVFLAPGNHDCFVPGSPYAAGSWPGNVRIFTGEQPRSVALEELGVRVWGAAFRGPEAPPLLAGFTAPREELLQLMVLHGDASGAPGPYNPVSRAEIAASGLDYLALGHVHTASGLLRAGATAYAWPGCAMGRGFDETGPKGVYVGRLEKGGCRLEFVPLPGRQYHALAVEAGDDPAAAVLAALPPDAARDCFRIRLTGACPPPDLAAVRAALEGRCWSLELRDETVLPRDVWARRGEDSLTGAFLDALAGLEADGALRERAAQLGLAALEGREL